METLEDIVDLNIAGRIVATLGGPYHALALRATSRKFRALIPAPRRVSDPREIVGISAKIGDTATCLKAIARENRHYPCRDEYAALMSAKYGNRELCKLIVDKNIHDCASCAMQGAAESGNRELCEEIMEWTKDNDYARGHCIRAARCGAAAGNRVEIFMWALEYVKRANGPLHPGDDFIIAAACGSDEICELIYKLSSGVLPKYYFHTGLGFTAKNGNMSTCIWLKSHGARDFSFMATEAAIGGHFAICKLAIEWIRESTPSDELRVLPLMFTAAVEKSHYKLCRIIYGWIVERSGRDLAIDKLVDIFETAALRSHQNICIFLHDLLMKHPDRTDDIITRALDKAMVCAVHFSITKTCELLHSWGARNYELYLEEADKYTYAFGYQVEDKNDEMHKLINGWIEARDSGR